MNLLYCYYNIAVTLINITNNCASFKVIKVYNLKKLKIINFLRICDKCVLRYDHHCPWLKNCIGIKNHRSFLIYLVLLNLSAGLVLIACLYCMFLSLKNSIQIKIFRLERRLWTNITIKYFLL